MRKTLYELMLTALVVAVWLLWLPVAGLFVLLERTSGKTDEERKPNHPVIPDN